MHTPAPLTYRVSGMTCGGCVASLMRALQAVDVSWQVDINLEEGLVSITGDHEAKDVQRGVEDAGFDFIGAVPLSDGP